LLEAIDRVGPPFTDAPFDLFAFHTGTLFAIEAAVARPRQVRRLALAGVPYVVGAEREDRYRLRVTNAAPPRQSGSRLVDVWHRVVTMRSPRMSYERAEALAYDYIKAGDRYWWAYNGVFSYQSEVQLPKVEQPTLLLAVHDSLLENTRRAAGVMPGATLRDLPELTGEGVLDEGADLLATALREWLV
jgi:pimeloyl-ACP methyl ester carboxylesterase